MARRRCPARSGCARTDRRSRQRRLVSVVSLWEIVAKTRVGKLEAEIGAVARVVEQGGFPLLGITPAHLTALAELPGYPDHRDPFDHLLVAQASAEDVAFLTDDRDACRYPVQVIACA